MPSRNLRRPSPAIVVSVAAALLASTGVASAAGGPTGHAAKSKPKPKPATTVAKARFATNAGTVGGYSVSFLPKANTLLPLGPDGKFPASVLPSASGAIGNRGPAGPAGPQGPQGPAGPQGVPGLNAPNAVTVVFSASGASGASQFAPTSATASCPSGKDILGGGFNDDGINPSTGANTNPNSVDEVVESKPVFDSTTNISGWQVTILNTPFPVIADPANPGKVLPGPAAGIAVFTAYAVCG
jgi:hypothetical protein